MQKLDLTTSPSTTPSSSTSPWLKATDRDGKPVSIRRKRYLVWSYNECDGADGSVPLVKREPVTVPRDVIEVVSPASPGGRAGLYCSAVDTARCSEMGFYTTLRDEQGRPVREDAARSALCDRAPTHPTHLAWMPNDLRGVV